MRTKDTRREIHNFLKELGLNLRGENYKKFKELLNEYAEPKIKSVNLELILKDRKLGELKKYITENEARRKEIGCICRCHIRDYVNEI